MKKIPNCPDCGNKAEIIDNDDWWLYVIGCTVCGLKSSKWKDGKGALADWKNICLKKKKIENSIIIDVTGKMVIDHNVQNWCTKPYPDHPKGCSNYGKNKTCPPKIGLIDDLFSLCKEHWLAIVKVD